MTDSDPKQSRWLTAAWIFTCALFTGWVLFAAYSAANGKVYVPLKGRGLCYVSGTHAWAYVASVSLFGLALFARWARFRHVPDIALRILAPVLFFAGAAALLYVGSACMGTT
jgi:hypothetical protein